eukprot:TRINITY_DN941_c0_g2_i5.p1 TRINITY_DN941_c0_g2~~TRINITY_DN941_c0_g2_i5.p1  ORF type:complete len:234 (-),score=41.01 TRINITY_DN941_c0_g2_i5:14-715(-)
MCIRDRYQRRVHGDFVNMGKGRYVSFPLSKRLFDIPFIIFFLFNLLFVTYIIDLETLVIDNPHKFTYPIWPTPIMVDIIHWWGKTFDPVLLARPVWWRATIWLDVFLFGPYYVFALYAFIRGRDWIKVPSFVYSGILFANVAIIMMEEMCGPNKTHSPTAVWIANLPWLLFPLFIIARMWLYKHPFSEKHYPITKKGTHEKLKETQTVSLINCLLYTSPSPRDATLSRMPSSA